MKLNYSNLLINLLLVFVFTSCYKEKRIQPASTIAPPVTPNTNNSNNNTYVPFVDPKINSVTSEVVNTVDSNLNGKFKKATVIFSASFNKKLSLSYKIFASPNGTSTYISDLKYSSKLLQLPDSLGLKLSYSFNTDTILDSRSTSYYDYTNFYFTIAFYDEGGNEIYLKDRYSSSEYSKSVPIERSSADRIFDFTLNSVSTTNGEDINKNGYFKPFTSFSSVITGVPDGINRNCYMVIKYSPEYYNSTVKPFGKTSVFKVSNSLNNTYSPSFTKEGDSLTTGNYVFTCFLYDAATDYLMDSRTFTYSYEVREEDNRTFTLTDVNITPKEDFNNNSFPSSSLITFKLGASDNSTNDFALNIYYQSYLGSSSGILVSRNIKAGQLYEILLASNSTLYKGYYNIKIDISSSGRSVKHWDLNDFDVLSGTKFETINEDK